MGSLKKTACLTGHSESSEVPGMAGCFGKKFILMEACFR